MNSNLPLSARQIDRHFQKRARRKILVGLGIAVAFHIALIFVYVKRREEVPPPLSAKFVKRPPQMTRPLTLRKRARPRIRPMKRSRVEVSAPKRVVGVAGLSSAPGALEVLSSVSKPVVQVSRSVRFERKAIGPRIEAGRVEIARHPTDRVDLSLEMMDIDALDTGRYRALVVQDPEDKRKVKGYVHLTSVYAESMEETQWRDETGSFPNNRREINARALAVLAEELNHYTQIKADVRDEMALDDQALLEVPFVLITAKDAFELTGTEAENLGRYLVSGGFAYVELITHSYFLRSEDLPSLRKMAEDALATQGLLRGRDWEYRILPKDHLLYHCFFDFDDLPAGYWDVDLLSFMIIPKHTPSPEYLEGVFLKGRMALVYSRKSYRDFWARRQDQVREYMNGGEQTLWKQGKRQLQLGVNVIVHALTQEGSLAKRLVAE